MSRPCNTSYIIKPGTVNLFGLSIDAISHGVTYVHEILDSIDDKLVQGGGERLSELVELANLSAIIGNLYRSGIVRSSNGNFTANRPHAYPDMRGVGPNCKDFEIKVALEGNSPKGHLVKSGPHLIIRYVLAKENVAYQRGKEHRGRIAWIWEVRIGWLEDSHFNVSNTAGDSGKTAVINAAGMKALTVVYCDFDHFPLSPQNALSRKASRVTPQSIPRARLSDRKP